MNTHKFLQRFNPPPKPFHGRTKKESRHKAIKYIKDKQYRNKYLHLYTLPKNRGIELYDIWDTFPSKFLSQVICISKNK